MSSTIPCKNVVKVKFDASPTANQIDSAASAGTPQHRNITEIMKDVQRQQDSAETSPQRPSITPVAAVAVRSEGSANKPPRSKQLDSLCLLIAQHNKSCTAEDCSALFLINAEWMNAWYRCLSANDMSLYPGPISNWSLVAGQSAGSDQAAATALAILARAKQMRGLSFDGEECDFAEELEEFQDAQRSLAETSAVSAQAYDYQTCRLPLRAGLREDVDFYLLPCEAWQALHGWYGGGPPLPRSLMHSLRLHRSAPCVGARQLLQLPAEEDEPADGTAVMHELDLYSSSRELLPCVQEVVQQEDAQQSALRRTGDSFASTSSLANCMSTMSFPSMMELPGVGGAGLPPLPPRSKDAASEGTGEETPKPRKVVTALCHVCKRSAVLRCSKCGSIFYCGRDCQQLHWKYHKNVCAKLSKRAAADKAAKAAEENGGRAAATRATAITTVPSVQHDRAGKVGLANLGNSCYMNSSLQCLSHIKPLTLGFLSQRVMRDLNAQSRDGSGGKLAEQYSKLLADLWFEATRSSVSPHQLKATLGRINPEYAGLAQQDAHELIELLLDKLHEDLNRVKKKPYTEKVEWDGVAAESAVADQSWATHGLREDSVVRDLMGSLMRYQLTCADCGKVSLSFEYHTTLQVAIPRLNTVTKRVIFVPQVLALPPAAADAKPTSAGASPVLKALLEATALQAMDVTLDRLSTVRSLREAVRKQLPAPQLLASEGTILLVESEPAPSTSSVARFLRDPQQLGKLQEDAVIYAYCPPASCPNHVFVFQRAFEPCLEINHAGSSNSAPDWGDLLGPSIVGVPVLVSYERHWACSRLRYQVMLNVLRLFRADSDIVRKAAVALAGPIPEHVRLSNLLDLRLVDQRGASRISRCNVAEEADLLRRLEQVWDGAAGQAGRSVAERRGWLAACNALVQGTVKPDEHGQRDTSDLVERFFGTSVGCDKQLNIGEFGGATNPRAGEPNGILFVSLDLLGDCGAGMLDSAKIGALFPTPTTSGENGQAKVDAAKGSGGTTLYQCLQEHTKEETLDAGNEVYCSRCKEHRAARKEVRFCRAHLPQVLVLSLKRFEFRDVSGVTGFQGSAHREKIDAFVDFPVDGLDLAPFCHDAPAGTTEPQQNDAHVDGTSSMSTLYDLFAVCNHYGRMGFGHYTAAARDWEGAGLSAQWFSYDDNDVSGPCSPEEVEAEVHSRDAYILFYRRRGSPLTID